MAFPELSLLLCQEAASLYCEARMGQADRMVWLVASSSLPLSVLTVLESSMAVGSL